MPTDLPSVASDWVVLGRLVAPYGIKGWLHLQSFTEYPEDIAEYDPIWVGKNGQWTQTSFKQVQVHGKGLVALLVACSDRTQAEALVGSEVAVPRAQLPALEDGDYYWSDLEGLKVVNVQGDMLGVVDSLFETGANDVMVVRPVEGSCDETERLIPYVLERYVLEVDLDQAIIRVDWERDF